MDKMKKIEMGAFRISGELETIAITARQQMMQTGCSSSTAITASLGHLVFEPAEHLPADDLMRLADLVAHYLKLWREDLEAFETEHSAMPA